jgi:hypothetical protein
MNEFTNKRYTTLVQVQTTINCVTGGTSASNPKYFVYDNLKKCKVESPKFHPTSYEEIRAKAIELNEKISHENISNTPV